MSDASRLGHLGEDIAANYLKDKGYRILHRNWGLHKGYELDIVAMNAHEIVFVEVKTRSSDWFMKPEQAVNDTKVKHICMAAHAYVKCFNIALPPRFDIISIVYQSADNYEIKHIECAFKFPLNTRRRSYGKWF